MMHCINQMQNGKIRQENSKNEHSLFSANCNDEKILQKKINSFEIYKELIFI